MEVDQEQYERESECQEYADYGLQGYHPVALGEKFDGKYVVHQKLGWGHFSTVWLVLNQTNQQYMALKIQRSKESHSQSAVDELQMLIKIRKHQNDEGWVAFVKQKQQSHPKLVSSKLCKPLALLDNFIHHGIHGKHYCSIFELMGPNLLDLIQHYEFKNKRMPLWLIKKITIDVLMGLVNLHEFSGLIHTDLKPQNIMMKLHPEQEVQLIQRVKQYKIKPLSMKYLKNLQASKSSKNKKKYEKKKLKKKKKNQGQEENQQSVQQSQQNVSSQVIINSQNSEIKKNTPQSQVHNNKNQTSNDKNESKENKPSQLLQQDLSVLKWKNVEIKLNTDVFFKIADMGNACYIQKHFTQSIQTREYRSPQVLLGHSYEPNTDIWSLGCTVFEMMTNSFLFKPKKVQGISKDEDQLYKMIEILGPVPKQFATNGTESANFFNKKGKLLHGNPKQQLSLSILLHQDFGYTVQQAQQAEKFLLPMLTYEPKIRISAKKCLQSQWLWKQ